MSTQRLKSKEIFRKDFVLSGTNVTRVDIDASFMPAGLIRGFWVRLASASIPGFVSAVTDYPKILNAITYGAKRPTFNVMTAFPGKLWDNIWTTMQRLATPRTTPNANGFDVLYYLPFGWTGTDKFKAYREKDTSLFNVGGFAQPYISMLLDPYTSLSAAATSCTVTVVVEADFDPDVLGGLDNPINPAKSGDMPGRYLELLLDNKADLAVTCEKVFVTGGPRECVGVIARELDNTGAEVSDVFKTGVATPSKYEFKVGDADAQNEDEKVWNLDAIAQQRFGIAVQAGYHYWLANRRGHALNNVSLRLAPRFVLRMDNLNTVANRVLQSVQINEVDIDSDTQKLMASLVPAA